MTPGPPSPLGYNYAPTMESIPTRSRDEDLRQSLLTKRFMTREGVRPAGWTIAEFLTVATGCLGRVTGDLEDKERALSGAQRPLARIRGERDRLRGEAATLRD